MKLGLALSGGGYRGAAFHLGVLDELAARGLLDRLALLATVSSGSILGAAYALETGPRGRSYAQFRAAIADLLAQRTLTYGAVLKGLVDPFKTDLDYLAAAFDDQLFHGARLRDLPERPRLVLSATNLHNGNDWKFRRDGMGDRDFGFFNGERHRDFPVARAVAASAAFPPIFTPLTLARRDWFAHPEEQVPPARPVTADYVSLTDGGVYDNQAISELLADPSLTHAIASDGGAPFWDDPSPAVEAPNVALRIIEVMGERIRGLEFSVLKHEWARRGRGSGARSNLAFFSIDADAERLAPAERELCRVATNFSALGRDLVARLAARGRQLAAARIGKYLDVKAAAGPSA